MIPTIFGLCLLDYGSALPLWEDPESSRKPLFHCAAGNMSTSPEKGKRRSTRALQDASVYPAVFGDGCADTQEGSKQLAEKPVHQRAPAPTVPGPAAAPIPLSGTVSPGTGAAARELDSSGRISWDAQALNKKSTARINPPDPNRFTPEW